MVLISAISIEMHKETLFFPGSLTEKSNQGDEIQGFVSHAEFEQDCGHCHGPIHCVEDHRCQDCHQEVARERAYSTGLHGRLPGMTQCENCHPEHMGKDAHITEFAYNNVNHELLSDFSLELHQFDFDNKPMGCQSCHSQDSFISERLDCITCHTNGDHDFTASHIELYGTDCVSCHDGMDQYSNFEHADVFRLDGEHFALECEECHQEKQYAGTPQECSGCHEEPAVHAGLFGQDCDRCHIASAWFPAELKNHTFVVDHGDNTSPQCETCHHLTYTEYRCVSCHNEEEMRTVHLDEGDYANEECITCHPSGTENIPFQYSFQFLKTDVVHLKNSGENRELRTNNGIQNTVTEDFQLMEMRQPTKVLAVINQIKLRHPTRKRQSRHKDGGS